MGPPCVNGKGYTSSSTESDFIFNLILLLMPFDAKKQIKSFSLVVVYCASPCDDAGWCNHGKCECKPGYMGSGAPGDCSKYTIG